MAVSGSVGGKVPVVDDVLSSHEQQIHPTTSLDENSIEFEFQTDRNNYTDLRQTYLSLVLKLVKHRGFDSYKKEAKKEHNEAEDKKADAANDNEVPLITPVQQHYALHFLQCGSLYKQSANLQFKWTLCS